MIPRYTRPEMANVWSDETKFQILFEIEAHAATAMAKLGVIPESAARSIWKKGPKNFTAQDVQAIEEIDKVVKHDTIAFLTHVAHLVGEDARYLHQGMTSSDALDTALSVQLCRSADILSNDIKDLLEILKIRSEEHKLTPCIGRSHGIHAEPTTFGLKLAGFYAEFERNLKRLQAAREDIATCAISGAVGTFANVDPYVEEYVAEKMGLKPEAVSTQVIPRDRHAHFFAVLGVIASSVERLGVEIRHLQRTEVREVEEFFDKGQKGSSAMPHKRNPILSENITGLARMVRAVVIPCMENVALWHERDISHSSIERVMAPDACIALDFALARLTAIIKNMKVYPDNMMKNLNLLGGLIYSQRVLLALTQHGLAREKAYEIVQKNAMKVWEKGGSFLEYLKKDKDVSGLIPPEDLEKLFEIRYHLRSVDKIFRRVFNNS